MAKSPSYVTNPQGGLTTGQAAGAMIVGAGIGAVFGFFTGMNNKSTYQHQANILKIQADMEREASVRELRYMNEKYAKEGWAKSQEMKKTLAAQNLAQGASGFASKSSGDKRLEADTREKYAEAEREMNDYLFKQNFEKTLNTELKAEALRSQASQLAVHSKYAVINGVLAGFSSGLGTGAKAVSLANTFYRNTNDLTPMGETVSDLTAASSQEAFNARIFDSSIYDSKLSLETDPARNILKQLSFSGI